MALRGLVKRSMRYNNLRSGSVTAEHDQLTKQCYAYEARYDDRGEATLLCRPGMREWVNIGVRDMKYWDVTMMRVIVERRLDEKEAWRHKCQTDYLSMWKSSEERCGEGAMEDAVGRLYLGSDMSDGGVARVTVIVHWGDDKHGRCRFYVCGWGVECFDPL